VSGDTFGKSPPELATNTTEENCLTTFFLHIVLGDAVLHAGGGREKFKGLSESKESLSLSPGSLRQSACDRNAVELRHHSRLAAIGPQGSPEHKIADDGLLKRDQSRLTLQTPCLIGVVRPMNRTRGTISHESAVARLLQHL
jgi:hypothetical protein